MSYESLEPSRVDLLLHSPQGKKTVKWALVDTETSGLVTLLIPVVVWGVLADTLPGRPL